MCLVVFVFLSLFYFSYSYHNKSCTKKKRSTTFCFIIICFRKTEKMSNKQQETCACVRMYAYDVGFFFC